VFEWRRDRFGHRIEQRIGGEWCAALASIEGSADEVWPPSPPLQSLHIEPREAGPVALLVGKSGTSHWSVSIEAVITRAAFEFDIACRVHCLPSWLGNVYRITTAHPASVEIAVRAHEAIREQARPDEWRIRPCEFADAPPSTIRWRYRVALHIPEPN
jgi:hypothetical protein